MREQPRDRVLMFGPWAGALDLNREEWGSASRSIQMRQRFLCSPDPRINGADLASELQPGLVGTNDEAAVPGGEQQKLTHHFGGDVGLQICGEKHLSYIAASRAVCSVVSGQHVARGWRSGG